jgi:transcriptional regulator with XRE-family HTH domain
MGAFRDTAGRERLGRALRRLREGTGLSQPQFAAMVGLSQPKVSRAETGSQRISLPEVERWCVAADATAQQRAEVLRLAERALLGPSSWDDALEEGVTHFQREVAKWEASAGTLLAYSPAVLPGLTQTATYARRVFASRPSGPPTDLADRVVAKMERQRILYANGKRIHLLTTEGVLRWPFGPAAEHLEQLGRLEEVLSRPTVRLGILPARPSGVYRAETFTIYDDLADASDPMVVVEILGQPVSFEKPDQVEQYRQAFEQLQAAALYDDDARALLERVAGELRRQS